MILTFHKVSYLEKSPWWITHDKFLDILDDLHAKKFVFLDDYLPSDEAQVVLSFDGPYACLLDFALPELNERGIPFELFVIGNYIGKDNEFDTVEPLTKFMSEDELKHALELGGRLQWHTRSHQVPDLNDFETVRKEFEVPDHLQSKFPSPNFRHLAYPHGAASNTMQALAKKYFKSALAVDEGDQLNKYNLPRITVLPDSNFKTKTISVIIPNFNYGHLIATAIDSVLSQSLLPDEVIVIDDASTDNSLEVISLYVDKIKFLKNEINLGVVDTFNKAVNESTGDLILILGADNYLHPEALRDLSKVFYEDGEIGVVYYDFVIFDKLANLLAEKLKLTPFAFSKTGNYPLYLSNFSNIKDSERDYKKIKNNIHGSSMFSREAFQRVEGYKKEYPEDQSLWKRILQAGFKARKLDFPYLYYRQHSVSQVNTALSDKLVHHARAQKLAETSKQYSDLNDLFQAVNLEVEHLRNLNIQTLSFARISKILLSRIISRLRN